MKLIASSTILSLLACQALAVTEQVSDGGLRGANTNNIEVSDTLERLDRELQLSLGSSTQSISFSVAAAQGANNFCFNPFSFCIEAGAFNTTSNSTADASGNSVADAESFVNLWLYAFCDAYSAAFARACTFTKIEGDLKVVTTNTNGIKEVSLSVALKTATKTLAYAESEAAALSFVETGAVSYTSVEAYCNAVNQLSPFCAGSVAETELTQVAVAGAGALGQAHALAKSGSVTKQNLSVSAKGKSLDFLNGYISAYAKSWSYANAGAAAGSLAGAFTEVANESFAAACVTEYNQMCNSNTPPAFCGYAVDVACAGAEASGEAYALGLALAVAEAFMEAESKAKAKVYLSANIDCKTVAKLTWRTSGAAFDSICNYD